MIVQHNLTAINSNRQLGITLGKFAKTTEKLSSGYKINRAADDAAGLSISEKMRKQIRGLSQASENAEDGISFVQTADGALEEVHAMLQRGNELSVKAANGTLSATDRKAIQDEISQLHTEIGRVADTSKFNETIIFSNGNGLSNNGIVRFRVTYDPVNDSLSNSSMEVYSTDDADNGKIVSRSGGAGAGAGDGSSSLLARKVATEFVPNAIKQILDTYPSLKAASTSPVEIEMELKQYDGRNGTLAYASVSYTVPGYAPVSFGLIVDTDDFDDTDAAGTGTNSSMLESTIAHEMTHTVMQNLLTEGMATTYPIWLTEGIAQLSGGIFSAGWNSWAKAGNTLDTHSATLDGEPYGLGGLAMAYIGHKASGQSTVSAQSIANGIDKLFQRLLAGDDYATAIQTVAGISVADLKNAFENGGNAAGKTFVSDLVAATGAGAGSVASGSLTKNGTNILGNVAGISGLYKIKGNYASLNALPKSIAAFSLHVGADADMTNKIGVSIFDIRPKALELENVNVLTEDDATSAISSYDNAIKIISSIRSYYGAIQNRLEHTIKNLDNVIENTTSAESIIRDTDMATTMVTYSNTNILSQSGFAMLTQANQIHQGVLSLLH